jgi:hypothetical protein
MSDDVVYTTSSPSETALNTDQAQIVYDNPQDRQPLPQEQSTDEEGSLFAALEALRQEMASGGSAVQASQSEARGSEVPAAEAENVPADAEPQPTAPGLPPLPEALAPYQKELDAYFQQMVTQYLGVQPEQLQLGVQYIQEQEVTRQLGQLQKEWSVDDNELDSRLELVRERFGQLSPQEQQALDSVRGVKLIWAELEQEQAKQRPQAAPRFDRSRGRTATGSKPLFTKGQLASMSSTDRSKYYDQIVYAYQNGLVAD